MKCRWCKEELKYLPIKIKGKTLYYVVCRECNWCRWVPEANGEKK